MKSFSLVSLVASLQLCTSFTATNTNRLFGSVHQHQQQHRQQQQQHASSRTTVAPRASTSSSDDNHEPQQQQQFAPIPTEWKGEILQALSSVIDPDLNRDIVTLGFVQNMNLDESTRQLSFDVELTTPACPIKEEFQSLCEQNVNSIPWTNGRANVRMTSQPPISVEDAAAANGNINGSRESDTPFGLSQVKSIIAVSSCKGGVGKSTTSVNLAYALSGLGASVGIFDADVYGPSLPTMVTPDNDAVNFIGRQIAPLSRNGVKLMSFGYVNEGSAVMRGPMVTQLLDQFLSLTYWGPLDYLILDMPPGTGDIQLTLSQRLNITAAVIVTTPQELSFVDVERGIEMFDSVNVPCISVVENMAYLELDNETGGGEGGTGGGFSIDEEKMKDAFWDTLKENGLLKNNNNNDDDDDDDDDDTMKNKHDEITTSLLKIVQDSIHDAQQKSNQQQQQLRIFGKGHKKRLSEQWGIDHTYSIPLLDKIASNGDNGTPFILEHPDSSQALIYKELAKSVVREVVKIQYARESNRPSVNYDSDRNVLRFNGILDSSNHDDDDEEEEDGEDESLSMLSTLPSAELRRECKCAACVEELTGRQILNPEDIPDSVRPISMNPTGNYALSVDWSDGHRSLYPYRQIRSLLEERMLEGREEEEKTLEEETVSA